MKKFFITALATMVAVYTYAQDGVHLPLTGGALTGPVTGTSAAFSGAVNSDTWMQSGSGLINKNSILANNSFGVYFDNTGESGYGIYREPGEWTFPFPDLRIAFHTGLKLGAHFSYGGTRFYNNSDMITEIMSVGNTDNNVRVAYGLNVGGALTGTSATFNGFGTFNKSLSVLGPASDNIAAGSNFYLANLGTGLSNYASATQLGLNGSLDFWVYNAETDGWGSPRMRITKSGNIGIGTSTPDSKLTVAGKIHSQEVKVTVAAGADFVFEKDYNLKPLNEVAAYISANKHLPGIASAEDMKKNGLELGEMNIKLLQKIEELTLHLIEQNKRIEDLEKKKSL
ncbi:tail fiber protein [Pedobacter hiemivivus]|uniref:Peptidase S74 domain-containing protein n=1 Tax=Pedobacter hiemivivus TaxID=2530454 RepID=A0A4R0NBJ4_9SPHI|nr:tail fiber protein [Pedobacter hiemivivus]TCC97679.1 hypothetical protein EZ444_07115 [Pedobacter hiemivivus]